MKFAPTALLAAVLFAVVAAGRAEDGPQAKTPQTGDEFAGKTALVFLDTALRVPTWVLTDVEVKEIGGRMFLVGIGADTKREVDWRAGKQIRISWQLVTGYMLFTEEEYAKHVQDAKEEREDN